MNAPKSQSRGYYNHHAIAGRALKAARRAKLHLIHIDICLYSSPGLFERTISQCRTERPVLPRLPPSQATLTDNGDVCDDSLGLYRR